MINMKTKERTSGAQPPWGTFMREEDRYPASIVPKKKRNRKANTGFLLHTNIITSAIRHVVMNITVMHAMPEIFRQVQKKLALEPNKVSHPIGGIYNLIYLT
jgi:hypothetical protein